MDKLNDQDTKQKIGMYTAFILNFIEFDGFFWYFFVPQKCNDDICGLFENVLQESLL